MYSFDIGCTRCKNKQFDGVLELVLSVAGAVSQLLPKQRDLGTGWLIMRSTAESIVRQMCYLRCILDIPFCAS